MPSILPVTEQQFLCRVGEANAPKVFDKQSIAVIASILKSLRGDLEPGETVDNRSPTPELRARAKYNAAIEMGIKIPKIDFIKSNCSLSPSAIAGVCIIISAHPDGEEVTQQVLPVEYYYAKARDLIAAEISAGRFVTKDFFKNVFKGFRDPDGGYYYMNKGVMKHMFPDDAPSGASLVLPSTSTEITAVSATDNNQQVFDLEAMQNTANNETSIVKQAIPEVLAGVEKAVSGKTGGANVAFNFHFNDNRGSIANSTINSNNGNGNAENSDKSTTAAAASNALTKEDIGEIVGEVVGEVVEEKLVKNFAKQNETLIESHQQVAEAAVEKTVKASRNDRKKQQEETANADNASFYHTEFARTPMNKTKPETESSKSPRDLLSTLETEASMEVKKSPSVNATPSGRPKVTTVTSPQESVLGDVSNVARKDKAVDTFKVSFATEETTEPLEDRESFVGSSDDIRGNEETTAPPNAAIAETVDQNARSLDAGAIEVPVEANEIPAEAIEAPQLPGLVRGGNTVTLRISNANITFDENGPIPGSALTMDKDFLRNMFTRVSELRPDDEDIIRLEGAIASGELEFPITLVSTTMSIETDIAFYVTSIVTGNREETDDTETEDAEMDDAKHLGQMVLVTPGNKCFLCCSSNTEDLEGEVSLDWTSTGDKALGYDVSHTITVFRNDDEEITFSLATQDENTVTEAMDQVLKAVLLRNDITMLLVASSESEARTQIPILADTLKRLCAAEQLEELKFEKAHLSARQQKILAKSVVPLHFDRCTFASEGAYLYYKGVDETLVKSRTLCMHLQACKVSLKMIETAYHDTKHLKHVTIEQGNFGANDVEIIHRLMGLSVLHLEGDLNLTLGQRGGYNSGNMKKLLAGDPAMRANYYEALGIVPYGPMKKPLSSTKLSTPVEAVALPLPASPTGKKAAAIDSKISTEMSKEAVPDPCQSFSYPQYCEKEVDGVLCAWIWGVRVPASTTRTGQVKFCGRCKNMLLTRLTQGDFSKWGVCSKHRNNNGCPGTDPDFPEEEKIHKS